MSERKNRQTPRGSTEIFAEETAAWAITAVLFATVARVRAAGCGVYPATTCLVHHLQAPRGLAALAG